MRAAAFANSVTTLRDGMISGWLNPVQADVDRLKQTGDVAETGDLSARQRQFETRAASIRGQARSIAARSNELGKSTAAEMRALASQVAIAPTRRGSPATIPPSPNGCEQLRGRPSVRPS